MTRSRTSLYDYKQRGMIEDYRKGHDATFNNEERSWCPHCNKVIDRDNPECQWCGKEIEDGTGK